MTGNLHENLHDFHCDSPLFIGNKMFATKAVETNKIIICCQAHLLPKSYGSRDKTNANERTTVVTYCLDICSTLLAGLSGCIATLHLDALPLCIWMHRHSASGCIATLHLGALPLHLGALPLCIWVHCHSASGCIATLHLGASPLCIWVHCHSASGCIATLHLGALPLCIWMHCHSVSGCIATLHLDALPLCIWVHCHSVSQVAIHIFT